ncbi:MAG TPA: FHA domain-containing protein [Chthoniobacter sp.]|nr:FHA domain-containing protein [Chthoniobacter sp.]
MASLRLTFPEKDQPTVIALTGARLTIGRLPFNTIQIIDRTVSGFHAELISEHGHYRLHDRGSSNGTFVNGQKVSDYHLNEACTVSFGTVEAQFSPEDVAGAEEAETFPSRGEVNSVRQENAEMRATVSALREEITALRSDHNESAESGGATVSREEYDKLVVEREALKETQLKQEEELNRFKTDIAILKRDRLNLQLAYDSAQRELEQLKRKVNGAPEETALSPVQAATVVAAQADEVRIEVPKPVVTIASVAVPTPVAPPAEATPVAPEPLEVEPSPAETAAAESEEAVQPLAPAAHAPFRPVAKPYTSLPKAPTAPSAPGVPGAGAAMPKPTAPAGLPQKPTSLPKAPGLPAGALPKPPGAPSGGVRPLPRPVAPASGGEGQPGTPVAAPRSGQRPLPAARPLPPGAAKPNFTPAPKVGPKGTEKLTP